MGNAEYMGLDGGKATKKDLPCATQSSTPPSKVLSTRAETPSEDSGGFKSWSLWQFQKGKRASSMREIVLVSAGALGIWVWLGRKATKEERQSAMQLGEKFIRENGLPPQTALTRTFQGGEPEEFKSLFHSGW